MPGTPGVDAGTGDQGLVPALEAFQAAQWVGRGTLFSVLWYAAPALAGIDRGRTLWDVYQRVVEVERWWGRADSAR